MGFASVNLMLAHVLLITVGYAVQGRADLLVEAWHLVVDYPAMLLALAGTVLLLMVAGTSIRKARRKLRYESWHLLHLYAYLGVGLALPHQLWTGQEFLSHRTATVYWWSLWILAAGAILYWRLGVPVYRTLRHDLRVTAVVREGPGVTSVWMRGRRLDRLPVVAGQFFTWRFLSGPGWSRGHPYSLSGRPGRRPAEDHGPGPRRRQPGAGRATSPAPGSRWRDRTAGCTEGSEPGARSPCWPAASASPRCGPCWRTCRSGRATSP